jgi:hypothetical protein
MYESGLAFPQFHTHAKISTSRQFYFSLYPQFIICLRGKKQFNISDVVLCFGVHSIARETPLSRAKLLDTQKNAATLADNSIASTATTFQSLSIVCPKRVQS